MRLANLVAVITGGANGIGKATARKFLAEGAKVVIGDIDPNAGNKAAEELGSGCTFLHLDVSDDELVSGFFRDVMNQFGRIDVLVNNAGIMRDKQLTKLTKEGQFIKLTPPEFDQVIKINLRGVYLCTVSAAEYMIQQKSGVILNASSIVGLDGNFG